MARLHETLPRGDEPAGSAPGSGSARRPVPLVGFLSRLLLPGRAAVPSIRAPGTAGGAERANRLRTDVLQRDSRHRSDREADRRLRAHLRNYICRRAFSALQGGPERVRPTHGVLSQFALIRFQRYTFAGAFVGRALSGPSRTPQVRPTPFVTFVIFVPFVVAFIVALCGSLIASFVVSGPSCRAPVARRRREPGPAAACRLRRGFSCSGARS